MPFCSSCGQHVSFEEESQTVRGSDQVMGGLVYPGSEAVSYCPQCVRSRRRTFYWFILAALFLLAGIGALSLVGRDRPPEKRAPMQTRP